MTYQTPPFFSVLIVIFLLFVSIICCGCLSDSKATEKITPEEATQIAMHDPRTIKILGNNEYSVSDMGLSSISAGTGAPEEVYQITFDVPNGTYNRVIVFVNFSGDVVMVDTPYTAKAPEALLQKPDRSQISPKVTNNTAKP
jgi:hypothetical protein